MRLAFSILGYEVFAVELDSGEDFCDEDEDEAPSFGFQT